MEYIVKMSKSGKYIISLFDSMESVIEFATRKISDGYSVVECFKMNGMEQLQKSIQPAKIPGALVLPEADVLNADLLEAVKTSENSSDMTQDVLNQIKNPKQGKAFVSLGVLVTIWTVLALLNIITSDVGSCLHPAGCKTVFVFMQYWMNRFLGFMALLLGIKLIVRNLKGVPARNKHNHYIVIFLTLFFLYGLVVDVWLFISVLHAESEGLMVTHPPVQAVLLSIFGYAILIFCIVLLAKMAKEKRAIRSNKPSE